MADSYLEALQHMDSTFMVEGKVLGESGITKSEDLIFSGRIFIYHESDLSLEQIGALAALYKSKGIDVKFRSHEYAVARSLTIGAGKP